jgi:hypothetical protein
VGPPKAKSANALTHVTLATFMSGQMPTPVIKCTASSTRWCVGCVRQGLIMFVSGRITLGLLGSQVRKCTLCVHRGETRSNPIFLVHFYGTIFQWKRLVTSYVAGTLMLWYLEYFFTSSIPSHWTREYFGMPPYLFPTVYGRPLPPSMEYSF